MNPDQNNYSSLVSTNKEITNESILNSDESFVTFTKKIAELLNNLKYEEVKQCLKNVNHRQTGEDFKNFSSFPSTEIYKFIFLQELLNHFINHQKVPNSSSGFDMDAILQLIILSIPISSSPLKMQHIKNITNVSNLISYILKSSAEVDFKYTFIIYRSKCVQLINTQGNIQPDLISLVQYFKYMSGCYVLMTHMKQERMVIIFKQYLEMLEEAKKIYENLYQYQGVIGKQIQELQPNNEKVNDTLSSTYNDIQLVKLIHLEYLTFCSNIVSQCLKILEEKKQVKAKIYQIIDTSISHLVMIVPKSLQNSMINEKLFFLRNKLENLIICQNCLNSNARYFSLQSVSDYPSLLLLEIFTSNLQMLISKQTYLFLLYRLFISFSQKNTIDAITGGKWDQMYNQYLSITSKLCIYLIQIDSVIQSKNSTLTYPRVQSEKLYLSEQFFINLPNLYFKLSIFNGFLSPNHEFSNSCQSQIRRILCLSRQRYIQSFCPRASLKLWSKFLEWSNENEIQYRIYCITQYRKLLSSSFLRKQISQGRFETKESHEYHRHTWILIDSYEKIVRQIHMIMKKLDNMNYNYVGHVISFIANYLVCNKLYLKNTKQQYKWDGYQKQKLREDKEDLGQLIQSLRIEMQKKLQIDSKKKEYDIKIGNNHNRSAIELQLVIFRCKQLKFNE